MIIDEVEISANLIFNRNAIVAALLPHTEVDPNYKHLSTSLCPFHKLSVVQNSKFMRSNTSSTISTSSGEMSAVEGELIGKP